MKKSEIFCHSSKRGQMGGEKMIINKRGQITIFIILGILIVASVILVFVFRDNIFSSRTTSEFSEVYASFDDCVNQKTLNALQIVGVQGGYIEIPKFEAGSDYAPFSSQLDFLGNSVPYWYYVSSNGLIKEQVPTISGIEKEVEKYLEEDVVKCDFTDFRKKGILVDYDKANVKVNIQNKRVDVEVNMGINVQKENNKERKTKHEIKVDSRFGELYATAKDIYAKQKKEALLENYTLDVLYNYAPVTGAEISCAPLTWNPQDVINDLKQGISANVAALKTQGDYYNLKEKRNKYFVLGVKSDYPVNFMYNPDWPTRVEIWPVENSVMVAEPIGLEEGMGILGFCYVPYHFVYDIYHPVLIQVMSEDEIFQFPVAVVIDKSVPREALKGEPVDKGDLDDFCSNKNTRVDVYTYDSEINPLQADIKFNCFNERCGIGKTSVSGNDAVLSANFPQCVNGKITASAEGYTTASDYISTNEPTRIDLVLDKLYELDIEVLVDGSVIRNKDGMVIVRFDGETYSTVANYPINEKIKLASGIYNVSVQVFSGSDLTIPASTSRQCVQVPKKGIGGIFGGTNEECFDINTPATTLSNALSAGGKSVEILSESSDLKPSSKVVLNVPSLPRPTSLEQLQQNYELTESNFLEVNFR